MKVKTSFAWCGHEYYVWILQWRDKTYGIRQVRVSTPTQDWTRHEAKKIRQYLANVWGLKRSNIRFDHR